LAANGALVVKTGEPSGRSPKDRFIVEEPSTADQVFWGDINQPCTPALFDRLLDKARGYLHDRDLYVFDGFAGAERTYRLPIRVVADATWHALFADTLFVRPTPFELEEFEPGFTVINCGALRASADFDGTRSSVFVGISFTRKLVLIIGSMYGGEMKKAIFSVMNYLLPQRNVLPMHCSANVGHSGDVALFFGLSGTGKTTLSADPARRLIGDDEHGWSDEGIFNIENGCYAKVINLSPTAEPQIYACTRRFGTILENVPYDPVTRRIDLDDESITENTRASYPLEYIENAVATKMGGHPKNIILLTCDASGVMPPIAKLTPEQTLYHFISGYTSKLAGTEAGLGKEPEITFSTCFGAPFMVHHPYRYAELLKRKITKYGVNCWLVNTGWIGGPYGIGKRISIQYTRNLLNAALSGKLVDAEYYTDPVFGFSVPKKCDGVPENILYPAQSWPPTDGYMKAYKQLAARFVENFKKYALGTAPEVANAGPKI
jgi:phosphoenolpyruvate carboxykinase (ATP)